MGIQPGTFISLLTATSVECPSYEVTSTWSEIGSAFFSSGEEEGTLLIDPATPVGTYYIEQ
jgi:hypothetical protein